MVYNWNYQFGGQMQIHWERFTFIWVHDCGDRRGRVSDGWAQDESKRKWYLEYKLAAWLRSTTRRNIAHLFDPFLTRLLTLKWVKDSISFNLMFFPWSEMIRIDPSFSGPDWWSELIQSDFCTCLLSSGKTEQNLSDFNHMLFGVFVVVIEAQKAWSMHSQTELHSWKLSEIQFTNMSDDTVSISIVICGIWLKIHSNLWGKNSNFEHEAIYVAAI